MKKIIIALIGVLLSMQMAFAAVSITTSAKTFQKSGGAASIVVTGDGAWTATSDSSWIVIKQGASGTGAGSCVYIVNANTTADVRIGHIRLGGNTFTITQYGYEASISPKAASFDRHGGSGSITVMVDAGITWKAIPNDDWITVAPKSGVSVGTISYNVAEYPGVTTRVGSITIGSETFTVTQTGVDVSISPENTTCSENADIIGVTITALAQTQWTVTPNAPWISVIDKANGYGDYVLTLAVNANPSFERRIGTVTIGSATLTIVQDGLASASLSINPPEATASASGAYGNIAVYATPDAKWTATSLTPWVTIAEGANEAGNGNIKYVASANPTLEERTGTIKITPPYKAPDCDLYAGMIFELSESRYGVNTSYTSDTDLSHRSHSAVGNGERYASQLPKTFTGSDSLVLGGDLLPRKKDNSFAMAFTFSVGELGCVNRLLKMGDKNIYLDIENRLWVNDVATTFVVGKINSNYTVILSQEADGSLLMYAGHQSSSNLKKVLESKMTTFNFSSSVQIADFNFGYTTYPSVGYLGNGKLIDIKMWLRSLTSYECVQLNSLTTLHDSSPAYVPSGIKKWWYLPLDGNAYYATESKAYNLPRWIELPGYSYMTGVHNIKIIGLNETESRFGFHSKAMSSETGGKVEIPKWTYSDSSDYNDMSMSMWIRIDALPVASIKIIEKKSNSTKESSSNLSLLLNKDGRIGIGRNGLQTFFSSYKIPIGEWIMLSVLGKSQNSIAVYCDDIEIGNVSYPYSLGDFHDPDGYVYYSLSIGGHNGAIDDLVFYEGLLTAVDVRSLYNAGKPNIVYHTVKQGVQEPKLATDKGTAPAEGATGSVALTLAQRVTWEAKSNCNWITITGDTEGAGSASIAYQVAANPTVVPRTGTLTIAGLTYTVTQEGLWADVECDVSNFGVDSDFGTIWVDTEGAGQWTATTDADWIHILTESGNGADSVMFVVDDYTTTTQSRTGTITIAGKTVVITQQGYELSIDPMIADVGSNAGAGQFGVAAPIDAVWEAIADCDWITIIGARTGIGDGVIQYTIADNLTGETRTGRIIVGGKAYTITQRTTLPLTTKTIGNGSVSGAGNYNQGAKVTLTAVPAPGYEFSHWSGDAVGVTDSVSITMDTAKNVTATFIPEAAAQVLAEKKAAQGGFYTRDQIHALEVGNLVLDVDSASGTARVGVQLMETSDLSDPNSWRPVNMTQGNLDVGNDGTVGLNVKATGNAKFFKVVVPEK